MSNGMANFHISPIRNGKKPFTKKTEKKKAARGRPRHAQGARDRAILELELEKQGHQHRKVTTHNNNTTKHLRVDKDKWAIRVQHNSETNRTREEEYNKHKADTKRTRNGKYTQEEDRTRK
jgi:hypothetical protein